MRWIEPQLKYLNGVGRIWFNHIKDSTTLALSIELFKGILGSFLHGKMNQRKKNVYAEVSNLKMTIQLNSVEL